MSVLRHSATVPGVGGVPTPSPQPTENHAAALRRTLPCLYRLRGNLDAVWLLRACLPDDAAADGEAKPRLLPARGLFLRLGLPRLARLAWGRILLRPLR